VVPPRLAILIDYQNIHLTGREKYAPIGVPPKACLIHPLKFAEQVLTVRAGRQRDQAQQTAILEKIQVYRGLPSNSHQSKLYAAAQAQRAEWMRDPRVTVWYRPLRYPPNWPSEPAREKGVDVKVAIDLVRLAESGLADTVVLASHDTDLEPALEMAGDIGDVKVETAGWDGARRLRVSGRRLWHTALDASAFVKSRDRKMYA